MARGNTLLEQYRKERRRIQRFVRETSKRGYKFPEDIVPKKAKEVSPKDLSKELRKARSLTSEKLYKKSKYTTPEGKTISGTKGRQIEKSKASKKGWETRREEQDERDKQNLQKEDWRQLFNEGNIVLQEIYNMIEQARQLKPRAAEHLENVLNDQIAEYGLTGVCMSIAQSPEEFKADAEIALHYDPGNQNHDKAILDIEQIITGEIMTMEEAMQRQEELDTEE